MCRVVVVVVAFVVCAWLSGCGPAEPALHPVSGSVKFPDGKPAAGATVEFAAQHDGKTVNARGEVKEDGSYQLKTVLNGKEKDGALTGPHKVIVVSASASSSPGPRPTPVPVRYAEYANSGLTFEVKPDAKNDYPITVQRK